MSPMTNSEKAKVHARRAYFCNCGQVVHGNGGRSSHRAKHERQGDGAWLISRELFRQQFGEVVVRDGVPVRAVLAEGREG